MVQIPDALGVLLPAADESLLSRARTVVQFLRLISDDARSARAGAVSVGIEPARSELERQDRRRVEAAIDDLLRHHLSALATPDTFLWWGDPSHEHSVAWRVLDEFRDEMPWLATPRTTSPGERGSSASPRDLGLRRGSCARWRPRAPQPIAQPTGRRSPSSSSACSIAVPCVKLGLSSRGPRR